MFNNISHWPTLPPAPTTKNSYSDLQQQQQQQQQQQRALFAWLHDHTSTNSIAKAIFRNQNYNTGYAINNFSRTSKQAEIYFMSCILIK